MIFLEEPTFWVIMRAISLILLFLAVTTSVVRAQDCQLKLYDSIDLDVSPNRVLVPVTLGDAHKKFALKIGNAFNGISEDAANDLGLTVRSINPDIKIERGPVRITRQTRVPKFQLGNIPINNLEFIVLPAEANIEKFDGDIGIRVLGNADFEIDIPGKKFNIFSQDHCPGKVVYWKHTDVAQIPFVLQGMGFARPVMQLDGHEVFVSFDLSGHSQVTMNAMRNLFGLDEKSSELTPDGIDEHGTKLFRYHFKTLVAGGLTISSPEIRVVDVPPGKDCGSHAASNFTDPPPVHSTEQPVPIKCEGGGDLILGYSVLSSLRLFFSLKEKQLYLTASELH